MGRVDVRPFFLHQIHLLPVFAHRSPQRHSGSGLSLVSGANQMRIMPMR